MNQSTIPHHEIAWASDPGFLPLFAVLDVYQISFVEDFGWDIFERGKRYKQENRVVSCDIESCSPQRLVIGGSVRGSRRYAVCCYVDVVDEVVELTTSCSCPYQTRCKHAAALLLEFFYDDRWSLRLKLFVDNGGPQEEKSDGKHSALLNYAGKTSERLGAGSIKPLSKEFERKLDELAGANPPLPPHVIAPRYQVGYRLLLEERSGSQQLLAWSISPILIQSSHLGIEVATQSPEDFHRISSAGGVMFAPEDGPLLLGLGALSVQGRFSPSSYGFRDHNAALRRGDLLLKAVESGRCFLSSTSTPLRVGSPISARLGWYRAISGHRLPEVAGLADGVKVLDSEFLQLYVKIRAGYVGEIALEGRSVPIGQWLRQTRVKPEQAFALVTALKRKGLPTGGLEDIADSVELPKECTPHVTVSVTETTMELSPLYGAWGMRSESTAPVVKLGGEATKICAVEVTFRYGDVEVSNTATQQVFPDPVNVGGFLLRNSDYERRVGAELQALGLMPLGNLLYTKGASTKGMLGVQAYYRDYLNALVDFVSKLIDCARKNGWALTIPHHLVPIVVDETDWGGSLIESSQSGWFEAQLHVEVQGEKIDVGELLVSLLKRNERDLLSIERGTSEKVIVLLRDKTVEIDRARLAHMIRLVDELADPDEKEMLRFNRYSGYAFDNALRGSLGKWKSGSEIVALRERVSLVEKRPFVSEPPHFEGKLRDYQQQGVAWLSALASTELGGVLADDMGLGKTVQIIALMLHERTQGNMSPNLVVCPKSVVPNWISELTRFAPSLKVYRATGAVRAKSPEELPKADVIITTYPLLLKDERVFSKLDFNLAIFDEAQHIKNPLTGSYLAAAKISARLKLPVSGTPLENNLQDLWAHFNLTMPGFLYSLETFKKRYRKPIEKDGDTELREHLAARIKPFVMRRTKQEVAKELPPLTEIVQRCSLEGAQRDLYETIRQLTTKKVRDALAKKGARRSHIEFLDALLKLRQVCCDPRLVKTATARSVKKSAKLDLLMELLPTLIEEGRSVVVFSQFTSMLDLIEKEVQERSISYCLLTGETSDRESPVKAFQSGDVPLFLMSLKAGGVGLNLTAADTVVIYDPWWNPAVESQAICRAHRIGQTKPVFAYRLVVDGTIEEKILELQVRKRALVENLLSENERPPELTEDLIDYLFAPIE